ncbi:MAG: glycosyltransferase [Victivallales bacterium]|nr:glycosyltransferase [Victivallales bacterium]
MNQLCKEPLISVIVPVFQVEDYLDKCISSIIAQSYRNLEIILVDDGSQDNCPAICDKYQLEDSRIKVIHKENGGLSRARNAGLKIATGDYIGFVDSDDWIEPNMYEILMSALQDSKADIAVGNYQVEPSKTNDISTDVRFSERKLFSSTEALQMIIDGEKLVYSFVWNKLYTKTVITNLFFTEGRIYEDILWTPKILGNAKSLVYIDCPFYHYRLRAESLTHNNKQINIRLLDRIEMLKQRMQYIHDNYPSLEEKAILMFKRYCYREYIKICVNTPYLDKDGKIRRELHRQFCQSGPRTIQFKANIIKAFGQKLFRICPWLFMKIYIIRKNLLFKKGK